MPMTAPAPPPRPYLSRPRSIALYLLVLSLVALVPAFGFSAVLLQRNNDAQEQVVEALITGSARSIMQAVDREVTANISTLKVLATTPTLLDGDYRAFHTQVKAALAGSSTYVYVLDSDYYSILSTRADFGAAPVLSNDIPSAKSAVDGKDVVVSGLVVGRVSGRKVFNVLYPVFQGVDAPLVLGISRDATTLETALLSDKLPDGWKVAMVDSSGTIIAASGEAGKSGDIFALANVTDLATSPGLVTLRALGETYRAAIRRSFLTDWTLIAWAPQSIIARPLTDAVWSLAVGGLLLAAFVILIVYWVTLQIGRSVRGLEADARRLGSGQPIPPRNYPISEIVSISAAIEDAGKRRQQAETEVRFLMRELAHRSKNQMTVIAAMAKQTARGADSVPEFILDFEKRIFGLARSTDLLLANGIVGVDLKELITGQIDPLSPVDSGRVSIEGPPTRLNNQAAQILGMAFHELATNAAKYGAFRTEEGRLDIAWHRDAANLSLTWHEKTPDPAPPSDRRGFGTSVLENMVVRSLGASAERKSHDEGIEWVFLIPLASIDPAQEPAETA
ncbi:MAG: sensor histidine kinase [Devosia sp.]